MIFLAVTLLAIIFASTFLAKFIFKDGSDRRLPPEPFHWFWFGNVILYSLDPVKYLTTRCKEYSGVFTLDLVGRKFVVVGERGSLSQVYRCRDEVLSSTESIKDFGFDITLGENSINHGTALHRKIITHSVRLSLSEYVGKYMKLSKKILHDTIVLDKPQDVFDLTRRVILDATSGLFIEENLPTQDPKFIEDFYIFQEEMEEATAKAVVLRKKFAGWLLRSVAIKREKLVEQLWPRLLRAKKECLLTPYSGKIWEALETDYSYKFNIEAADIGDVDYTPREKAIAKICSEYLFGLLFAAHKNLAICAAQVILFLLDSHKDMDNVVKEAVNNSKFAFEDQSSPYLEATIEETLRLTAHALGSVRRVMGQDGFKLKVKDKEYIIPKGYYIGVSHIALSLDGNVFPEPLSFKPSRFLKSPPDGKGVKFSYVPFSGGVHSCPGMLFARSSLRAFLSHFFSTYQVTGHGKPGNLNYQKATLAQRDKICNIIIQRRC